MAGNIDTRLKQLGITLPVASAPVANYVNWLRGDYFARHLLGSSDESVDITELNKEIEQVGDKRRR